MASWIYFLDLILLEDITKTSLFFRSTRNSCFTTTWSKGLLFICYTGLFLFNGKLLLRDFVHNESKTKLSLLLASLDKLWKISECNVFLLDAEVHGNTKFEIKNFLLICSIFYDLKNPGNIFQKNTPIKFRRDSCQSSISQSLAYFHPSDPESRAKNLENEGICSCIRSFFLWNSIKNIKRLAGLSWIKSRNYKKITLSLSFHYPWLTFLDLTVIESCFDKFFFLYRKFWSSIFLVWSFRIKFINFSTDFSFLILLKFPINESLSTLASHECCFGKDIFSESNM